MEARILRPGDEVLLAAAAAAVTSGEDEDGVPAPHRCRELLSDPCFVAVAALEGGNLSASYTAMCSRR